MLAKRQSMAEGLKQQEEPPTDEDWEEVKVESLRIEQP